MRAASQAYSRVGCAARFPDLACNGRALAAEMRAASHTYSRVGCALLAFLALPATAGLAAQMSATHLLA
eukprot:scaffold12202_cov61-Phaeocystis_antarctica.AAC.2